MSTIKYLKEVRIKKGLTINEVVEMSGGKVDKTSISRIERDERGISMKIAYYLSKVYGISIDDIAVQVYGKASIKKPKVVKKKKQVRKKKK